MRYEQNSVEDDYSHHGLNANNMPLFQSLDTLINQPLTALWIGEIFLATLITGGSLPAALYISSSKLLKNTPYNIFL